MATAYTLCLRDVSQAYVQSTTAINREIYATPPKELAQGLPPTTVMKIKKPLYGIPEAGTHWFHTYHTHHQEKLFMIQSTYDPCLLHTIRQGMFGLVGMQTDDTLILGDDNFIQLERDELTKAGFLAKPLETLSPQHRLIFNGCIIQQDDAGTITICPKNQGDH